MKIYLNLSHIHKDLEEIPCEVRYKLYKGYRNGRDLDPDELDVLSVKLSDPNDCPIIGENEIAISDLNHNQIEESIYAKW